MASKLSHPIPQTELFPERRFLVLSLPRWATDFAKRHDPALAQSKRPLVLYERSKGALHVAALDRAASNRGLSAGQALADARAQVPDLEVREIDRDLLDASFADFADWHSYASPLVAVLADMAPFGDLCLDITGVSHLFGGEAALLERITSRLNGLGFSVFGVVASSIGAAWALAHCHRHLVLDAPLADALAPLPVAALRLQDGQIDALNQLGLKRIGQLYGRDRKGLQARFGESLLRRLDQALGEIEERMVPRLPATEHFVEHCFAEPVGLLDDVLMCAHDLAVTLAIRLESKGMGARNFHLFLYRVDHKVMTFSVNAGRATRDADHIGRLFSNRAERLGGEYDAGFGIDMIRLAAGSVSPVDPVQSGVFEAESGTQGLERLIDRMTSRLGPLAVVRSKFVDSFIPERAVRLEPLIARTPDDPLAAPDQAVPRPLRLLPSPEPISVIAEVPDGPPAAMTWRRVAYRFGKASGPERIAAEWWRGGQLPMLTSAAGERARTDDPPGGYFDEAASVRDYYIVEDETGRRFWVFRQGLYRPDDPPGWYMHGLFA